MFVKRGLIWIYSVVFCTRLDVTVGKRLWTIYIGFGVSLNQCSHSQASLKFRILLLLMQFIQFCIHHSLHFEFLYEMSSNGRQILNAWDFISGSVTFVFSGSLLIDVAIKINLRYHWLSLTVGFAQNLW